MLGGWNVLLTSAARWRARSAGDRLIRKTGRAPACLPVEILSRASASFSFLFWDDGKGPGGTVRYGLGLGQCNALFHCLKKSMTVYTAILIPFQLNVKFNRVQLDPTISHYIQPHSSACFCHCLPSTTSTTSTIYFISVFHVCIHCGFVYAISPCTEYSPPTPDSLNPPMNPLGSGFPQLLIHTVPASICPPTRSARSTSLPQTLAPRPWFVAFARSMASASVEKGWTGKMGPVRCGDG